MRRFAQYFAGFVAAALVIVPGAAAFAQAVRVVAPQRVSVKAEAVPLGDLLTALNEISPVASLNLDPSERGIPVTLIVEDVRAVDAMWLVLKESKLDFIMSSKGVWAGRAKKAAAERGDAAFVAARTEAAPEPEKPIEQPRDNDNNRDDRKPANGRVGVVAIPLPATSLNTADVGGRAQAAAPASDTAGSAAVAAMEAPAARDEFARDSVPVVPFTVRGDSVRIDQTGFVPLKLLPEVVKRRLSMDLTKIP